jgi:RNA polymerase sigma factor (sigma-70 family)
MNSARTKRALADWFNQWRSPLRTFLRRKSGVPAADVDDVAQEVFLRLMRYEKAELIEHPQAYIFKTASNIANEWAIRSRRRRPHDAKWLISLISSDEPEGIARREEVQREVEHAVGQLTPRQRQLLDLFIKDNLSQQEIAEKTGDTPRTVRRQLANAYAKLRHELDIDLLGDIEHGRK